MASVALCPLKPQGSSREKKTPNICLYPEPFRGVFVGGYPSFTVVLGREANVETHPFAPTSRRVQFKSPSFAPTPRFLTPEAEPEAGRELPEFRFRLDRHRLVGWNMLVANTKFGYFLDPSTQEVSVGLG